MSLSPEARARLADMANAMHSDVRTHVIDKAPAQEHAADLEAALEHIEALEREPDGYRARLAIALGDKYEWITHPRKGATFWREIVDFCLDKRALLYPTARP